VGLSGVRACHRHRVATRKLQSKPKFGSGSSSYNGVQRESRVPRGLLIHADASLSFSISLIVFQPQALKPCAFNTDFKLHRPTTATSASRCSVDILQLSKLQRGRK